MKIDTKGIKSIECKHAFFVPTPNGYKTDMHFIKRVIHTNDGRSIPDTRIVYDYKRPFYITKKAHRNHEQRKLYEKIDKLDRFETTQTELVNSISRALTGRPAMDDRLKRICRTPYVYGADILSTTLIKRQYQTKYPDSTTANTVASFDVETDVFSEDKNIIIASLTFKDKAIVAVTKKFLGGIANPEEQIRAKYEYYLREKLGDRIKSLEICIVDKEIDILFSIFKRAHEWKPDFIEIWNISFDIERIIDACKRADINPSDILNDPSVPRPYRHFHFKKGQIQKKMASGKISPIEPAAQWHTVSSPASFSFIDGMCVYRHLRIANEKDQSYNLDYILNKHELGGKLKFTEADGLDKLDFHKFMQEKYKIEYIIYNIWDCVGMEMLDEKTMDISLKVTLALDFSDLSVFNSQPRRKVDELHFEFLGEGYVIGTTSDEMGNESDDEILDLTQWITALKAERIYENGLCVIEEFPHIPSNIRCCTADLDVAGAYPHGQIVLNIENATTYREVCSMDIIDESVHRLQGINLSGGHTNALEFCQHMFNMPTIDCLILSYQAERLQ